MNKNKNSGQSLLVVLFIAMIGLTVAVATFTETLNDVALTKTEENSEKAFKVAEAGIEHLLSGGNPGDFTGLNDVSALVDGNGVPQDYFEISAKSGESVQIDKAETGDAIKLCWNGDASIFFSKWKNDNSIDYTFYKNDSSGETGFEFNTILAETGIDPNGGECGNGEIYSFIKNYSVVELNGVDFIRLKVIGADDDKLEIFADGNVKGIQKISSSAQVASSNETRKIEVNKTGDFLPEIFDYVLFSDGQIIK